MRCVACSLVLVAASVPVRGADLPPGALARLGDDRFRVGQSVYQFALSPDGRRFATAHYAELGQTALTVWDATTGRPLLAQRANTELFKGLVWGANGPLAVTIRAELNLKDKVGTLYADDFRVWDFTDPKAAPPVLPVTTGGIGCGNDGGGRVAADRPDGLMRYTAFDFSADGTRAAARWVSPDGKHGVNIFELKPASSAAKLTRLGVLKLGATPADAVRFSADGKTAVTFQATANEVWLTATVWDVGTGTPGKPMIVPHADDPILTPDGRALVVFTAEEQEWGFDRLELATGKQRALTRWRYTAEQLNGNGPKDSGVFAFSPNGRELFVAADGATCVIDLAKGKELGRLDGNADTPSGVAVSADGTTAATVDRGGLVRVWDTNTLRPFEEPTGHRAPVRHAELAPDGKRLLTWAEDRTVRLWDLATGKEQRAFTGAAGYGVGFIGRGWQYEACATFTPDGTAILYSGKNGLVARDVQTGRDVPLPGAMKGLGPRFAVFAPDGKAVLTWSEIAYRTVPFEVWDWPSGKKRFVVEQNSDVSSPRFSPDGALVYMHSASRARWDAKTGEPRWRAEAEFVGDPHPLSSLRPNPQLLFDDSGKGPPRVRHAGTGAVHPTVSLGRMRDDHNFLSAVWGVAFSPCFRNFTNVWGDEDRDVRVCETATGETRREFRGHLSGSRVLGFTPDGTKLLTTGADHTVLVWDVRLSSVPLPNAIKKETDPAKLWDVLATGKADAAYRAMARLARDPAAALKLLATKLKPAVKGDSETDATRVADGRAIELLEALDTDGARALLKELAGGSAPAFRTREAKRALERFQTAE